MRKTSTVAGTTADPTIQFAKLKIRGKEYKLAYSFNAIAEAEASTGLNLLTGLAHLDDLTAGQLRGLFYAALKLAQPEITPEQAGDIIGGGMLRELEVAKVTRALAEAYGLSMAEAEENPTKAGEDRDLAQPA